MKILFDFDAKTIELQEPVELVKLYDTFDEYGLDWKEWIVIPKRVYLSNSHEIWTPTRPLYDPYKVTC